jgi:hypothetical protein
MLILSNRLSPYEWVRGMSDKHQIVEEPYEVKISRTVLKTSRTGDSAA